MKKLLLVLALIILAAPLHAQKTGEINVRYSRQDASVRIVLEGQEDIIRNSNTITSLTSVKIEFPASVEIKKQKDFMFETTQKDKLLVISLRDVVDAKTYKLMSPSRIVIDLKTAPKPQKDAGQKTEQKPVQDISKAPKDLAQAGVKNSTTPPAAQAAQQPKQPTTASPAVQTGQQQKQPAPVQAAASPPEKTRKIKSIVLDAGHGGFDQGIVSRDIREKDIMLGLAKDLGVALSKKGITVSLTRKTDQPVPLAERINFASAKKPDLFISLHATTSDRPAVYSANPDDTNADSMIRTYTVAARQARHIEKSRLLAKFLGTAIRDEFKKTVLLRELPLPLVTSADAPAVIVEFPQNNSVTYDQKTRERIIKTLLSGIAAYEQ